MFIAVGVGKRFANQQKYEERVSRKLHNCSAQRSQKFSGSVVMFNTVRPMFGRSKLKVAVAALLILPFASSSHAGTTTGSFGVRVTLTASCVINSASNLNFGSQGVLIADIDQTSTIQVQCTNTTPYSIGLDAGQGSGATVGARKMTNGSATVTYSLYSDTGRTTVWGNTVNNDTVASTGTGSSQSFTVYGRVPAQSTPAPGNYTDTVRVTVSY
jgi:spore coat protein U-like protein